MNVACDYCGEWEVCPYCSAFIYVKVGRAVGHEPRWPRCEGARGVESGLIFGNDLRVGVLVATCGGVGDNQSQVGEAEGVRLRHLLAGCRRMRIEIAKPTRS